MKNRAALLGLMAMATDSRFGSQKSIIRNYNPIRPKVIPKGCKKFSFDGFECIALNEKSALKKYNNYLKKITP